MLTISSWPPGRGSNDNQYARLYYEALSQYGVATGPPARIEDKFIHAYSGQIDAIQVQWVPEQIWRSRGAYPWQRLRGVLGLWTFFRLAQQNGIKILWTLHDAGPQEDKGWIDELGYRLLAKMADLCIVHDEWAAEQYVQRFHGDPIRLRVMEHGNYDGVFPRPAPRQDTLDRLGVPGSRRILLCQGLVRPYKRYDLAIQAASRLGAPYHLIIAGAATEPEFEADLRSNAKGKDNVTLLLESQSIQALSDLFAASDCYLLPYEKITGSGSLLTTATLGRGFVASDLPYFRRALTLEPNAAVLFKTGSVDSLAQAIQEFFSVEPQLRHQAARRIADRVPWREVVKPVVEWLVTTFPDRVLAGYDGR